MEENKGIPKCIITEDGNISFKGDFNTQKLITLLRQELIYQKELEKKAIKSKVNSDDRN